MVCRETRELTADDRGFRTERAAGERQVLLPIASVATGTAEHKKEDEGAESSPMWSHALRTAKCAKGT
jgi:hypothetical protein